MINKKIFLGFAVLIALALNFDIVIAAADFAITTFSCTPSEVVINDVFSCSATIENNGDTAGSVSIATLYPDSNNWLEDANYPQASGTSVDPGNSIEATFTGLRATKSGNNGFTKITLDSVTDTYVADNSVKVNVINVVVSVSDSVSSAAKGVSFTSTAEVTAGGNIDVTLTFTVDSGGCSIGSQSSQKTISDMQEGNKQTRTWTVTQGTTGDCRYTTTASATGDSGTATKTDSDSSTVTCTNCPTGGSSSSSSGGGGGGGGGTNVLLVEELTTSIIQELAVDQNIKFKFGGVNHTIALINLTSTTATVNIESEKQTFIFIVGEERQIDLDGDGKNEISLRLKSINIITKKALFILTPLYLASTGERGGVGGGEENAGAESGEEQTFFSPLEEILKKKKILWTLLGIAIALAIIIVIYLGWLRHKERQHFGHSWPAHKN